MQSLAKKLLVVGRGFARLPSVKRAINILGTEALLTPEPGAAGLQPFP